MKYAQLRQYDVANGEGVRASIFVSGCTHNCYNCFNKEYQKFSYGETWTDDTTMLVIDMLKDRHVDGKLSLLGGEPFQQCPEITKVLKRVIKNVHNMSVWIWSGYTFEEIIQDETKLELLKLCDVLVDGKFIEEQKDLTLAFRGSRNQRIINIKESLRQGRVILYGIA